MMNESPRVKIQLSFCMTLKPIDLRNFTNVSFHMAPACTRPYIDLLRRSTFLPGLAMMAISLSVGVYPGGTSKNIWQSICPYKYAVFIS